MSEQTDLLVTWGREFCNAIGNLERVSHQDAYEVHLIAIRRSPEVGVFAAMGEAEFAALASAACSWLETDAIETKQMRLAVNSTLDHWRR